MLGTRITSFAFGFACASGLSMYKLKEEIWSSHKILANQVRKLLFLGVIVAPSPVSRARCTPPRRVVNGHPRTSSFCHLSFLTILTTVFCQSPLCPSLSSSCPSLTVSPPPSPPSPPMARSAAVRGDGSSSFQAGDDRVQAMKGDAHGRERWVHGQQSKAFVEKKSGVEI